MLATQLRSRRSRPLLSQDRDNLLFYDLDRFIVRPFLGADFSHSWRSFRGSGHPMQCVVLPICTNIAVFYYPVEGWTWHGKTDDQGERGNVTNSAPLNHLKREV